MSMRGRKNIENKISELDSQISDLEDRRDHLQHKLYSRGVKRRDKQHRKKMASSLIYMMQWQMSNYFAKVMFKSTDDDSDLKMVGLLASLKVE